MRYKLLRYIAYVLEILTFNTVQQTPSFGIDIWGIKPSLLIPIASTIALFESETASIGFGTLCGLLMDFGFSGTIGINSFLLPLLCYILSVLSFNVIQTNFITSIISSFVLIFFVIGLNFLVYYLRSGDEFFSYTFINISLPRILYAWLTVPVFYLFNKSLSLHIVEKE